MAQRKKGKEFQDFFTSYQPWESALVDSKRRKSILIVDVHSTWCGPCTAVVEFFKKIFLEKGEDYPIQFIVLDSELVLKSVEEASADEHGIRDQYVEVLRPMAGKSQPHFLFFLSGVLRKSVVGVNTPIIQKTIDRLIMDIDEGKNTGEEGTLTFDDEEDAFSQTPRDKVADLGMSTSDDKKFFDTMTTEEVPPDSARSTQSNNGPMLEKLRAYINPNGVRLYSTGNVDGEFTEVSADDPSYVLGFVAPASESENFSRVLYSYFNPEKSDTILVTSPQDIQLYNDSNEWTDAQLLGFLYESEREGAVALHALSKDMKHVYTIDTVKVEELTAEGYTNEGILGYVMEEGGALTSRSSLPSRPESARTPVELDTPREEELDIPHEESENHEDNEDLKLNTESKEEPSVDANNEENQTLAEEPASEPSNSEVVNTEAKEENTLVQYRIHNKSNNLVIEINSDAEAKDLPSGSGTSLKMMPPSDTWKQLFTYDGTHFVNHASGLRIHHANQGNNTATACMLIPSEEKHQIWNFQGDCLISPLDGQGLTINGAAEGEQVVVRPFNVNSPPEDCRWELVQI